MLAHARRLIKASAFLSVFKLYVVLVWGGLLYLSMYSGVYLQNQYDSIKISNDGQKKKKKKILMNSCLQPLLLADKVSGPMTQL